MKQSLLDNKITEISNKTGVYQFLNDKGDILYIGKAVNLKSRVRSYFASNHHDRPWIEQMIPQIADIRTIETENEVEALILESNLIKKYKPKYNADLKDDKSYAWIFIDTYSPFPRLKRVRETKKRGRYFGPYPDGRTINRMLKFFRQIYPYADCNIRFYPKRNTSEVKKSRVCLYYHLGQCPGPCDNLISTQQYRNNIDNIIKTLQGKKKGHIRDLEEKMGQLSQKERFEDASAVRDKISDLKYLSQRIDIGLGDTEHEFKKIRYSRHIAGLKEAIAKLGLNIPEHVVKRMRVECYDISNISGQVAYGSMSVAVGGQIEPSQYRIFKIRDEKKDDTAMMKHVLNRRLRYLKMDTVNKSQGYKDKKESLTQRPHIILLDGGKTQLSVISSIVPKDIGLLAISKGKHLKRAGKTQHDEFWKKNIDGIIRYTRFKNPFIFQQLRDEAHRFAIKYHIKGRRYLQKKSALDNIEGIGPKRKKLLMKKFETVSNIRKASVEDIADTIKSSKVAEKVHQSLNKESKSTRRTRIQP